MKKNPNQKFWRWHCFDAEGHKVVKTVAGNYPPEQLPNHSEWQAGLGKLPEEQRQIISAKISARVKGVPKSEEQKRKMRLAKLGVPKSDEHRKNMSLSQIARAKRMREERENASS